MACDIIGVTLAVAGLLVGQVVEVVGPANWGALMQGGALLVLSLAFLHIIVKMLPEKDKAHAASMAALVERYAVETDKLATQQNEAIHRLTERHSEIIDALANRYVAGERELSVAINNLRVHCATHGKS